MCKVQLAFIAVLAVLSSGEAAAGTRTARSVLPSGKCNTYHIDPVPIDYDQTVKVGKWKILYVTDVEPFNKLDRASIQATEDDDGRTKVDVIHVNNENSKTSQTYWQSYVDKVVIQDAVDKKGSLATCCSWSQRVRVPQFMAWTAAVSTLEERVKKNYMESIFSYPHSGKPYHFHIYPLLATKSKCILFYRCSDATGVAADTRYIMCPANVNPSESDMKLLVDADKEYNFEGELYKLPYALA